MGVPYRSPDGSTTRDVPMEEIGAYEAANWSPVNPEQQVTLLRFRQGQPEPFFTTAGNVREVLRVGQGHIRPFQNADELGMLMESRRDARLNEEASRLGGGAAALTTLADLATVGGYSALLREVDPHTAEFSQRALANNPDTVTATTIAGLLTPMGLESLGARLGTTAFRGARFMGVGGAGEAAGLGVRSLVRRGVQAAGLPTESLIARVGPQVAGLMAENAAVATGLEAIAAIQQNRDLSSEIILADAGIGTAFGLGIMGMGAGMAGLGRRFTNRAQNTNGGRVVGEGLLDAARRQDQPIDMDWWRQTVLSRPADNIAGRTIRAQSLASSAPEQALQIISHPGVMDIATDYGGISARGSQAYQAVDNIITTEIPLLQEAVQSTRWLNQHVDTFASLDGPMVRSAVNREVSAARRVLTTAEESNVTHGVGRAERAAARELNERLDDVLASEVQDPRQVLEELLRTKRAIEQDAASGAMANPAAFESTRTAMAQLRSIAHNETIFQDVGRLQRLRDEHFTDLINAEKGLLQGTGRINQSALVEGDRVISRDAIMRMIRREGKELDGAAGLSDSMGDFRHNLSVVDRSLTALAELGGVEQAAINRMRGKVVDATRAVEEGSIYAASYRAFMEVQNAQRRGFGLLSGMGLGGGAVGGAVGAGLGAAVGGPLGAVAGGALGSVTGFAAGAAFSFLANPANGLARLSTVRRIMGNYNQRLDTGLDNVRKSIRLGHATTAEGVSRVAGRGVQAYYDLHSPDKREAEYQEMRRDILEVVDNPELMMDRLAYTSAGLDDTDPYLADAFNMAAVRGVTYLRLQLPEPLRDPLSGEEFSIPPSVEEVEDFVRKYAVVEDPLIVLDRFASRMLQPAEIQALQNVYPQLYGMLVGEVAAVASEFKATEIDYETRIQMSILFDIPTDNTMDATFMAAMQNQGYQTMEQANAIQGSRPQITRTASLVDNTFTETQRLLQR